MCAEDLLCAVQKMQSGLGPCMIISFFIFMFGKNGPHKIFMFKFVYTENFVMFGPSGCKL